MMVMMMMMMSGNKLKDRGGGGTKKKYIKVDLFQLLLFLPREVHNNHRNIVKGASIQNFPD